jgi:hypothetical protein
MIARGATVKPNEVWSFPLDDGAGTQCLCRVMLAVVHLGLPPGNPMAFVHNCLLVQLGHPGRLNPDEFASHVLVDGVFLAYMPRIAKRLGFKKVAEVPAPVEAVAFPCWLIERDGEGLLFCQGEITQRVLRPEVDASVLYRKWNVRLSPAYPAQLAGRVLQGVADSDLRYNPQKQECLRELGVDLVPDYMAAVEQRDPNRRQVYERAMRAGRPTSR